MRLLFTGGGGAGNEAIFRLWHDRFDLHFADASLDAFCPSLPEERRHAIPFASDPDFVEALASLCTKLAIHLLVPAVDEELPHMPEVGAQLSGLRILVPDPQYVTTMLDKLTTVETLRAKKIDVPRTVTIDRIDEVGFPCFAKPRYGRGSRGIQILADAGAAQAYQKLSGLSANQIVVQELLQGQEYTIMMAADANANLHAVMPVRVDAKRGITLRAETDANTKVIEACAAIHRAYPARGCYNIQLFVTGNDRTLPFEINPRISTTFCLGVAAGIDPVEIFFNQASPKHLLSFRSGVKLQRFWYNHIC